MSRKGDPCRWLSGARRGIRTLDPRIRNPLLGSRKDADNETSDKAPQGLTAYLALLDSEKPDLAGVIRAWPDLPGAIKAGILAMVKAAAPGEPKG